MTTLQKIHAPKMGRRSVRGGFVVKASYLSAPSHSYKIAFPSDLDERFEDAQLNAIADERAEGPFVKVSLDEL